MNKIIVGFTPPCDKSWMGGVNYYVNLLESIKTIPSNIRPIIFIGKKTDPEIRELYLPLAEVVESTLFDRKSPLWFIHKIQLRLFSSSYLFNRLIKQNKVFVLSHSDYASAPNCISIPWIADFQHFCLPDMFSKEEINARDKSFAYLLKECDALILSSFSAYDDLNRYAKQYSDKAQVLHFVSRPTPSYWQLSSRDEARIRKKYGLVRDYLYLPNQFWKHKNHIVVFKAIKELKSRGIEPLLVCSGAMSDYRNESHVDTLINYTRENKLENNIVFLNLIPYEDVFALIKFSQSVINPSLFEGWSSTVEECKSVMKNMVLSDIEVHKEQYPEALFFDRNSYLDLADKMENLFIENSANCSNASIEESLEKFEDRFKDFGTRYIEIINNTVDSYKEIH